MTNPKHTTEEYLAWIDERVAKLNELINNPCAWGIETEIEYRASLLANRDVLVRHEPVVVVVGLGTRRRCKECSGIEGCGCCSITSSKFPCPTYLDIAQRLDEVM